MRTPRRKKQLVARLRSVKTTARVLKKGEEHSLGIARGEYVRTFLHKTWGPHFFQVFFLLCKLRM